MRGFGVEELDWPAQSPDLMSQRTSLGQIRPLKCAPGRMVNNSHKHTPKPYGKHSTLILQLHLAGFIVFVKTISTLITITITIKCITFFLTKLML